MKDIIIKLKSMNFDVTDENRILEEISNIGYTNMLFLARYKKNIKEAIDLYVADMRISRFFWRHIRRLEIMYRASIINALRDFQEPMLILKEKKLKISKDFIKKYTTYIENEDTPEIESKNKKIIRAYNQAAINYSKKKTGLYASNFFSSISLGKSIDVYIYFKDRSKDLEKISELVELRNKISHFHILTQWFSIEEIRNFWSTIKSISSTNEKTDKNDEEFNMIFKQYSDLF